MSKRSGEKGSGGEGAKPHPSPEVERLQRRVQTLASLLEVGRNIVSTLDLEEVLHRSFESVEDVLNAERSSVWRLDEGGKTLSFFMARGEGIDMAALKNLAMEVGEGVVGQCALGRKPVIISDAPSDARWSSKVDRKTGFQTRSILAVPLEAHGKLLGVIQVLNRKDGEAFTAEDADNLLSLGAQIAIAMENAALYEEKRRTFLGLAVVLAEVIEQRDEYTGGHVQRVVSYSLAIGRRLGLDDEVIESLRMAAILHDIGKIGIEDRILNKPGRLDDDEERRMQEHTVIGAQILGGAPMLQALVPGVRHHHERYDGKGYPDGLGGEEIPLVARIISVADTYDAMTSTRPYRKGLSQETALEEMNRCAGEQFCPAAVEAFEAALEAGELEANPEDLAFI